MCIVYSAYSVYSILSVHWCSGYLYRLCSLNYTDCYICLWVASEGDLKWLTKVFFSCMCLKCLRFCSWLDFSLWILTSLKRWIIWNSSMYKSRNLSNVKHASVVQCYSRHYKKRCKAVIVFREASLPINDQWGNCKKKVLAFSVIKIYSAPHMLSMTNCKISLPINIWYFNLIFTDFCKMVKYWIWHYINLCHCIDYKYNHL